MDAAGLTVVLVGAEGTDVSVGIDKLAGVAEFVTALMEGVSEFDG